MATTPPPESSPPGPGIDSLINEYVERRQSGEGLTPQSFAAEHPDLAEDLQPYLNGLALLERVCPLGRADTLASPDEQGCGRLPAVAGYEVLEEVGRGGMGVVYKALQLSTKRVVALKVMLVGPFASSSARQRFDREVELAARLQHPGIVRVLDSGQAAGQKYFAMDFVEGLRLDRYLGTQPEARAVLQLFEHICEAVDYAHRHGIIHRDLKPANVLVDDEQRPHVLDFGLAKATDPLTQSQDASSAVSLPGQVLGTLFYLSPEQATGTAENVDARSDVYSLGVMLFEALTGTLPFKTDARPSDVIQQIVETPPARPSALCHDVKSELDAIILKALEKDQDRRYESAAALGADLRRYLQGEPIVARRPSSLYVLRKKVRKHRLAVGTLTVAVCIGVVGLIAGLQWHHHDIALAREDALLQMRRLEAGDVVGGLNGAKGLHARHPGLPEAILVFCQATFRNRMQEQAVVFLERALPKLPDDWVYRELLLAMYRAAGDVERADALAAQPASPPPDTADAWYLRSFTALDLASAEACAERAVQLRPAHELAWLRLTWLRWLTADLAGALQGAETLIELGQDAAEWTIFKGQILARGGRFADAIEQYSGVIHERPEAHVYRAHALRRLGRYEDAVADYTVAIDNRSNPRGNVWERYQRATPLWILGRRAEAAEDYRQVRLTLGRPFYADARRYVILCELGRDAEAQALLAAALEDVHDPWLRQIFRCLAGQLAPQDLVAAGARRQDLERLCEAYYYSGEACLLARRQAEARQWFELCVQTGVQFDVDTLPLTPMNEYELAEWRLRTVFGTTPPNP